MFFVVTAICYHCLKRQNTISNRPSMPYTTAKKKPYGFPVHFWTDIKDNP